MKQEPSSPSPSACPQFVGKADIARVIGVTPRRAAQLVEEGVIVAGGRNAFDLEQSVKRYVALVTRTEKRRAQEAANGLLQRQSAALDRRAAIEDRKLITLNEAEQTVDTITSAFLACLDSLPARMTKDPAERDRLRAFLDDEQRRLQTLFAEETLTLKTGEAP